MGQNIASKLMFCVFISLRVLAYEKLKLCKVGFCFLFLLCILKFFDTRWFLCICKDTFIFQDQVLLFAVESYRNKQSRVCYLGLNKAEGAVVGSSLLWRTMQGATLLARIGKDNLEGWLLFRYCPLMQLIQERLFIATLVDMCNFNSVAFLDLQSD